MDEGWVDAPLLKPLPPPPPEWIKAPGALLLAVSTQPGVEPYVWVRTIAVGWARSPVTGVSGVLLGWDARRRVDGEVALWPRCGWFRYDPARCQAGKPTRVPNPWGLQWWGQPSRPAMVEAMRAAVLLLPPALREHALTPARPGFDVKAVPDVRGLQEAIGAATW